VANLWMTPFGNPEDVGEVCKGLDMTDVGLIWK